MLDASASFTNFAAGYLRHHRITPAFEVSGEILDQFRGSLSDREIRPGIAEWSAGREWKGDEVEAQRDPVILKAIDVIGG